MYDDNDDDDEVKLFLVRDIVLLYSLCWGGFIITCWLIMRTEGVVLLQSG